MSKKKKLVVGNWKMNIAIVPEAKKVVQDVKRKTAKARKTEVVFCPPAVYFQALAGMMQGGNKGKYKLGAQNVSADDMSQHTGEISVQQLKQFDVEYVIIGHSERRKMGETDEMVSKKIQQTLRADMRPIVCIGESIHDEEGEYLHFIKNQLIQSLKGISKGQISDIVIAYEPIWAVGGPSAMNPGGIHEMTLYIRKCLREMFATYADGVLILYGGSVNPQNTADIMNGGFVDGLLVGRDSIDAEKFSEIIKIVDVVK